MPPHRGLQSGQGGECFSIEQSRKVWRQWQHSSEVCERLVRIMKLNITAQSDVFTLVQYSLTQQLVVVISGKTKGRQREIGQRIVLV